MSIIDTFVGAIGGFRARRTKDRVQAFGKTVHTVKRKRRSWSIIRDRATGEFRLRINRARQGTRPGHRAARKGGAR